MNDHAPLLPPSADAETRRAAVYLVMSQIPPGKVVSYGELAAMAGLGRAARWVGRLMSQLPDDTTPLASGDAAGGRLSLPAGTAAGHEQRMRLRAEGLTIVNDRVTCVGTAGIRRSSTVRVRLRPISTEP